MASTVTSEEAGNRGYQEGHMGLIFKDGFSFSGYERDGLFLNGGGKKFKDISGVSGIDSILDGRSVVAADFDNDGDEDIFLTAIQDQGHQLFRNNVGSSNHFLRVALTGRQSGKDAYGAVVRVASAQGIQTKVKSGGNGFLAQGDKRLLFGLGGESRVDWIEVTWPSGLKQKFEGVVGEDLSLSIVEGNDRPETVEEMRSSLPDPVGEKELLWKKLQLSSGADFPELELSDLRSDSEIEVSGPVLVNLWATWCGPCRREMPELELLQEQLADRGIGLLGISVDEGLSQKEVLDYADRLGVTYPLASMMRQDWEKIFKGANLFVPLSIYINAEGQVEEVFAGWNAETEAGLRRLTAAAEVEEEEK